VSLTLSLDTAEFHLHNDEFVELSLLTAKLRYVATASA